MHDPVFPHSQAAELSKEPSSFGQKRMAEHLLRDEEQNFPLNELQAALRFVVPQEQSTELINAPLLLEQSLPREQVLLEESQ